MTIDPAVTNLQILAEETMRNATMHLLQGGRRVGLARAQMYELVESELNEAAAAVGELHRLANRRAG
jgi:hypothetical protein